MSSFSDRTISSFESLILECSLENARQEEQNRQSSFMSDDSMMNNSNYANDCVGSSSMEMSQEDLDMLSKLPGNKKCIDCNSDDTEWASVSFGIFLCAECSGVHRSLGTHISRVRSVMMDSWTTEQLLMMRQSGNLKCREYMEQQGVNFEALSIRDRYSSEAAALYHKELKSSAKANPDTIKKPQQQQQQQQQQSSSRRTSNVDSKNVPMETDPIASPSPRPSPATVADLAKAVHNSQRRTGSPRSAADDVMNDASNLDSSMMSASSMRDYSFRDFSMRDGSMRDGSMRDDSSRMNQYVQNFRERFANGRGTGGTTTTSGSGRGVGRTRSASSASSTSGYSGRQGMFGMRRSSVGGREPPSSRKLTRSVSASAPTVTYLGRSFRADTFVSKSPSRRSSMDSSSCAYETPASSSSKDTEFAKLKASLKDAGAMTSMSVKLKLQDFANYNSNNTSSALAPVTSNKKEDKAPKPPRHYSRRAPYSSWLSSSVEGSVDEEEYQSTIIISPIS